MVTPRWRSCGLLRLLRSGNLVLFTMRFFIEKSIKTNTYDDSMNRDFKRQIACIVLLLAALPAAAQVFPRGPLRLISPFHRAAARILSRA